MARGDIGHVWLRKGAKEMPAPSIGRPRLRVQAASACARVHLGLRCSGALGCKHEVEGDLGEWFVQSAGLDRRRIG